MTRFVLTLLSVVTLVSATGWLMFSEQVGAPLSVTEFTRLLGQLRDRAFNEPAVSETIPPDTAAFADLEQAVHEQVNAYRAEQGLPPLTLDERISQQSRLHSEAMASGQAPFSHDGFEQRVQTIARSLPYRTAAENVAYNQGFSDPVAQAVAGWIDSPGHRVNMEGNFDLTGIGVARNDAGEYYFTQVFIRRLF
jgi:uncharacterized protein YkwD